MYIPVQINMGCVDLYHGSNKSKLKKEKTKFGLH
jgi:hypothetical protein